MSVFVLNICICVRVCVLIGVCDLCVQYGDGGGHIDPRQPRAPLHLRAGVSRDGGAPGAELHRAARQAAAQTPQARRVTATAPLHQCTTVYTTSNRIISYEWSLKYEMFTSAFLELMYGYQVIYGN